MNLRSTIIAGSMIAAVSYSVAQPNNDERYSVVSFPKAAAQTVNGEPIKRSRRHYRERHSKRADEAPKVTRHPTIDDPRKPLKESMNLPLVTVPKSPDLTDMLRPKPIATIRVLPEPIVLASAVDTVPVSTQTDKEPPLQSEPATPPKSIVQGSSIPPAGEIALAGMFGLAGLVGFAGLWHIVRQARQRFKPVYSKPKIQPRRTENDRCQFAWWQLHHRLNNAIARQREQRSSRLSDQRFEYARSQLRHARPKSPSRPRRHDRHFRPLDDYPSLDTPLGSWAATIRTKA